MHQRALMFALLAQLLVLILQLPLAASNCTTVGCVNGACNAATGVCACTAGSFLTFSGPKCDQLDLTAPIGTTTKSVASNVSYVKSDFIDLTTNAIFQGGIPIGDRELSTRIYACSNGYVTFNYDFCTTRVDLLKGPGAPPFVAPLATSFDFRSSVGAVSSASSEMSYSLVPSVDAVPELKAMRDNLTSLAGATAAIVVTWLRMSPPPLTLDAAQKASFRLILFTDLEKTTSAVAIYSTVTLKDYFDWLPTLIGMKPNTLSSLALDADTRSKSVELSLKIATFGTFQVPMTVKSVYKGADMNYRMRCLNEAAALLQPPISTDVTGWCPRTLRQARLDQRYLPSLNQTSFSLIASAMTNATQISCAYNEATGGLLSTSSFSNVTSGIDNVTIGARLYEYCCDRVPGLCDKYYEKFPVPNSQNYKIPSAMGYAMGAGEIRSFDGISNCYQAVGDFWLVKAPGKLDVQVRTQNTNPVTNRTAGITGVALQFYGTTNFSAEFYWSKTTRQIASVSYSLNSGQLMNSTLTPALQFVSTNAVLVASTASLSCFIPGSSTWLSARANPNGLLVSVYIDNSYVNSTAGLLGKYDASSANDLALKNGTVANLGLVYADWKLVAGESLFKTQPTPPTPEPNWTALTWDTAWNTSHITQSFFGANDTLFAAANQTCTTDRANSTTYANCMTEYSDCSWYPSPTACSTAYRDQQANARQFATVFTTCATPAWDQAKLVIQVTEGAQYSVQLSGLLTAAPATAATYAKVSGPSNLIVTADGNLTWTPNLADLSTVVVGVSVGTGCSSLQQLTVKLTRAAACANAVVDFGDFTASYRRDKIYQSMCKCNDNYYTSNCSFATCKLNCHSCSDTTTCAADCPTNYDLITIAEASSLLKACSYTDRCSPATLCTGEGYKSCRSVDPMLQTATFRYQCMCAIGYQNPDALNKTVCIDTNECDSLAFCDSRKNLVCTNTPGSYNCACKTGYVKSGDACVDIDECAAAPGLCPNGNCVNTPGSYYCNCSAGYAIASPGQNCSDINECTNPALSGCKQNCTNSLGSFSCSCYAGFVTPPTCTAAAGCTNSSVCSYPDLCTKVGSLDTCYCPQSQPVNADSKTCTTTKYCNAASCGAGGVCTEANPGYNCTCKQHYELNALKICVPSDYCNKRAQYPTVCPVGDNVACSVDSTTNAPTCSCLSGYARNNATNACEDVNECLTGSAGCDAGSTECFNWVGSASCLCKFGFKRLNSTQCVAAPYAYRLQAHFADYTYKPAFADPKSDAFRQMAGLIEKKLEDILPIDVSSQTPTVRVSQMSNGSVVAVAVASYTTAKTPEAMAASAAASGVTVSASLFNECASTTTNDCSSTVHNCIDTVDGYTCQCKSGYVQTGTVSGYAGTAKVIAVCADVDECLTQCRNDTLKVCVNLPGSFTCTCTNGTYSSNATSLPCEDPCKAGRCQNGGQCLYQARDQFPYRCVCPAGYLGFNCESVDDNFMSMQRNAIIIGVVLGVLLLLALLAIAIFCLRKAHSAGTYKGTQSVALNDAPIPRAHSSSQHPSVYDNDAYVRETHKTRTDYF